MLGLAPPLPGLAYPGGHAHEMLFGFALALIAGHQLGALPRPTLAALAGCWMAARLGFLLAPAGMASGLFNVVFAALLAGHVAWRLLRSVKKARNLALPFAIAGICACAVLAQLAVLGEAPSEATVRLAAIMLVAFLMLFMGGRIIAPSVAGQLYRQGGYLEARVQPRIESALIVAMSAAVAGAFAGSDGVAAAALATACVLAATRMWRWRLWRLRGRPDLLCLGAGYAWLVAGLGALAAAIGTGRDLPAALHLITVGALGTLSFNVMGMMWARHARRNSWPAALSVAGTLLIAAAAAARVLAAFDAGHARSLLVFASAAWSAAYLMLLAWFPYRRRGPLFPGRD